MKIFTSSFIFIFLISLNIYAQEVLLDWANRYNGPGNDEDFVSAMLMDEDGNIYLTGQSYGTDSRFDYATIKYNSSGELQWLSTYSFPDNDIGWDIPTAITMDPSGFIYVTGYCWEIASNGYVALTIKYNSEGDTIWTRKYGGIDYSIDWVQPPLAIGIDSDNNIFVTGTVDVSLIPSIIDNVIFTIKYSSDGDTQWIRTYHYPGSYLDVACAMVLDSNGNPCIAGKCQGTSDPTYNHDYLLIKYNTDGDLLWTKTYAGAAEKNDIPSAMAIDLNDNIYVTGKSMSESDYDYLTIKYNLDGEEQWAAHYNGTAENDDEAKAIVVDESGCAYVTGISRGTGSWGDITTIKYTTEGSPVWVKRFDGSDNSTDEGNAICLDPSGNVYVTGYENAAITWQDFVTIKYDTDGNEKWIERYPNLGTDIAITIALDEEGSVLIAGTSQGETSEEDFLIMKYTQSAVYIEEPFVEEYAGIALRQNYPNPFNSSTKIRWHTRFSGWQTLKIYDLLGKEVQTLVDEYRPAGIYEIDFIPSSLNGVLETGIYYYQLRTGSFVQTRKMILI